MIALIERRYHPVIIASGQSMTDPINLQNDSLAGIIFPDVDMTNSTLKLQVSDKPDTGFVTLKEGRGAGASDFTINVYRNQAISFENLALLAGWKYVRLAGAQSEAAARQLILALRPV